MNKQRSLPPAQQSVQRFVDRFNSDEEVWRKFALKRIRRRAKHPEWSEAKHRAVDLLEFARRRSPEDCIGR